MFVVLVLPLVFVAGGYARVPSDLVLLNDAVDQGAVCLDGSPPGYYLRTGSSDGANKWVIHLEGGGWCTNVGSCLDRSNTEPGSTAMRRDTAVFGGVLSDLENVNPYFYNWNSVFAVYCDGSSFAGNVEEPITAEESVIYLRGRRNLGAIINSLLQRGMENATDVILTGCSAGGLATYLNADYVGSLLPSGVKYRAFGDAGYIPDIASVDGVYSYRSVMQQVFEFHNIKEGASQQCLSSFPVSEQWKCMIANRSFPYINTPTFVYNAIYDELTVTTFYALDCVPPDCDEEQLKLFENFGKEMLQTLQVAVGTPQSGIFAHSCLVHCQSLDDATWNDIEVDGVTAPQALVDWYNDDSIGSSDQNHKHIDCTLNSNEPCNPTCAAFGYGTASPSGTDETETPTGKATSIHQSCAVIVLLLLVLEKL